MNDHSVAAGDPAENAFVSDEEAEDEDTAVIYRSSLKIDNPTVKTSSPRLACDLPQVYFETLRYGFSTRCIEVDFKMEKISNIVRKNI